jgi:hypothetical protein
MNAPLLQRFLSLLLALVMALGSTSVAHAQSAATDAELSRTARDLVTEAPDGRALTIPSRPAGYTVERRGPVTIAYPPNLASTLRRTLDNVDRDLASLQAQFGLRSLPALEIRLVADPDVMRQLAPPQAPPPAYAVGVAYPSLGLTLVSASAPRTWEASDVRRVLRHELSHLLLAHATNHAPLPRWFSEGVAVEQAGEHSWERFEELARASAFDRLIPFHELDAAFSDRSSRVDLAYAQSADFVGFLLRKDGHARLGVFGQHLSTGVVFDEGMRRTWGMSLRFAENSWKDEVKNRHLLLPFVLGSSALWLGSAVLLFVAYVRSKRRGRRIMARWAEDEARADRAVAQGVVIPFTHRAPTVVESVPEAASAAVNGDSAGPDRSSRSVKNDDVAAGGIVVFLPYARKKPEQLPN